MSVTTTATATITRADESIIVHGYTWQCIWSVQDDDDTFWRVGLADEPYSESSYFDEVDTLQEAIEFVTSSHSDAEMEEMAE
ncbi:hypothetical protein N836_31550 [Leptolyngbya sp. Heron Island J]|uniref:hypothetical protein n=1 Tax=Leptolyngbya sp. Heron Island J TaxID=1385935 RepID=UPI0003B942A1|nr:hypothetical protein [Leptolyngbya sp. Heron Island J]ESA38477.1 hypothetical protein N836_31550 [Leptolyngbya sp. Heron Island J]